MIAPSRRVSHSETLRARKRARTVGCGNGERGLRPALAIATTGSSDSSQLESLEVALPW